jgi:hypothetical protein
MRINHPHDNLRWNQQGGLLAAGQHAAVSDLLSCFTAGNCSAVSASVVEIDPESRTIRPLLTRFASDKEFSLATSAVRADDRLWLTSAISARILKFDLRYPVLARWYLFMIRTAQPIPQRMLLA